MSDKDNGTETDPEYFNGPSEGTNETPAPTQNSSNNPSTPERKPSDPNKGFSTPEEVKTKNNAQDTEIENEQEAMVGTKPNPNGFFSETKSEKACSVCVAVRVRPLIGRELVVHERI